MAHMCSWLFGADCGNDFTALVDGDNCLWGFGANWCGQLGLVDADGEPAADASERVEKLEAQLQASQSEQSRLKAEVNKLNAEAARVAYGEQLVCSRLRPQPRLPWIVHAALSHA